MFDSAGGPYEAKATKAINMAMSFMYASGFWILAHHGLQLSKLIMVFLQGYTKCAECCLRQGFHRFGLMPKMHYIHHAADRLWRESTLGVWVKKPALRERSNAGGFHRTSKPAQPEGGCPPITFAGSREVPNQCSTSSGELRSR